MLILAIALVMLLFRSQRYSSVNQDEFVDKSHLVSSISPSESTERYLIPIHPYGPNNQILGLRNSFVVSMLLNRTIILPSLYPHYLDLSLNSTTDSHNSFPFESFLELTPLADKVGLKSISQQEFFDKHKNREISGPVIAHKSAYIRFMNERLPDGSAQNVHFKRTWKFAFQPIQYQLTKLATILNNIENLDDEKFVFLASFNPLEVDHLSLLDMETTNFIFQAFGSVRVRTKFLEELGIVNYVRSKVGGKFVSLQVRPKPDGECISSWGLDPNVNPKSCARKMPTLSELLARTSKALSICDKTEELPCRLFLAHIPILNGSVLLKIRSEFSSRLVTLEDILPADLWNSFNGFYKSVIEQSICILSDFFVGTGISTWAQNVQFEKRLATVIS